MKKINCDKFKKDIIFFIKKFLIYNIFLIIIFLLFKNFFNIKEILKYISFDTNTIKFQDLLSITITILSILVGAIITVATILISMCDKRILRLIQRYNQSTCLIKTIKIAIISGFVSILLLAIIYSNCDFKIISLRLNILYLSGLSLFIFFGRSKILIKIVLNILNECFKENSSITQEITLKKK
ncbi:hypothetical protein [Clostridium tarantellae]|uniref:Uncharacterized protein n=1 Tax=Clostridium tarantellae TaxID=39493 RepID=A0A6I1MNE2_9CLOT|nr:hypothetical protein [Clostridium tarantellae]MPQ44544.1 hypothetical protein [Clostridium tarantellae]